MLMRSNEVCFRSPPQHTVPLAKHFFGLASALSREQILRCLDHYVATHIGNRFCQRQLFRACLDAVLRETALLDSAISHQRVQAIFLEYFTGRMLVEELNLRDRRSAHKVSRVVKLRTNLHANGAGDTPRKRIVRLLGLWRDARTRSEIVSAIQWNPGFHAL